MLPESSILGKTRLFTRIHQLKVTSSWYFWRWCQPIICPILPKGHMNILKMQLREGCTSIVPFSHLTFHIVVQSLPGWCCVVLFHKYPFKAKSKAKNGTWLYLEQYSIKVKRDFILWSSRRNEHLYQLHYLSKNGNAFWRCVRDQPIRVQVTCCLFLYVLKTMCYNHVNKHKFMRVLKCQILQGTSAFLISFQ